MLNKRVMLINSREVILSVPPFSFFLVHNTESEMKSVKSNANVTSLELPFSTSWVKRAISFSEL